jgi:hypothetical protein
MPGLFRWCGLALVAGCDERAVDTATGVVIQADTDTDADTDGDVDGEAAAAGPSLGLVLLYADRGSTTLSASFFDFGEPGTGSRPARPAYGACSVALGETVGTDDTTLVDAGDVMVTLDGIPVALAPLDGGWTAELPSWPARQTVGFEASGADFPAFAFPSLVEVPEELVLDAPPTDIERSKNLVVRWSPSDGHFYVAIVVGEDFVTCSFDDPNGVGTVPAAALSLLPSGPAQAVAERWGHAEADLPGGEVVLGHAISAWSWSATLR